MNLDTWIRETDTKATDLAERVGLTEASISRIRRGLQTPSLEQAVKISDATGGAVQPHELLPAASEKAAA
jgi:DNA-binding transcriptional regulator YdaS (Cro superfamily)